MSNKILFFVSLVVMPSAPVVQPAVIEQSYAPAPVQPAPPVQFGAPNQGGRMICCCFPAQ